MEEALGNLAMPVFFVFFICFWVFFSMIIAQFGWSRLAEQHRAIDSPSANAKKFHWRSLSMGNFPFGYNNCIDIWLDDSGVFLRPSLLFRAFHPMIMLRWTEIRTVYRYSFFGLSRARVQMNGDAPLVIFSGSPAREIYNHWQRMHPAGRS